MKKAALVLLLLGACVLTFSMSFRKEPVPAELREIAVEPETAAAAEKFARDIQRIAKQKRRGNSADTAPTCRTKPSPAPTGR